MKSQVGLGRLYPDGQLDHAQDTLKEQSAASPQDAVNPATPAASEMLSVLIHVEKNALDALLLKTTQP